MKEKKKSRAPDSHLVAVHPELVGHEELVVFVTDEGFGPVEGGRRQEGRGAAALYWCAASSNSDAACGSSAQPSEVKPAGIALNVRGGAPRALFRHADVGNRRGRGKGGERTGGRDA